MFFSIYFMSYLVSIQIFMSFLEFYFRFSVARKKEE